MSRWLLSSCWCQRGSEQNSLFLSHVVYSLVKEADSKQILMVVKDANADFGNSWDRKAQGPLKEKSNRIFVSG